jgi:hypothetical protein
MKYVIQDTESGYELQIDRSRSMDKKKFKGSRITYREFGGHGELEDLYAIADGVSRLMRLERLDKRMPKMDLASLSNQVGQLQARINRRIDEIQEEESASG